MKKFKKNVVNYLTQEGTSMPDVESIVRLSSLFHTSLDELLLEEERHMENEKAQITLEDMMRINARNRRMNLLLCGGLVFLAIGIILAAFEKMLETTTENLTYILYRYAAAGQFQKPPINYELLLLPALLAGAVGVVLCLCYALMSRRKN